MRDISEAEGTQSIRESENPSKWLLTDSFLGQDYSKIAETAIGSHFETQVMTVLEGSSHNGVPEEIATISNNDSVAVPSHPLGIKPNGNAYTANENLKSAAGYFAVLPDELLVQVLECLDAKSLRKIERSCKTFYAFSRLEDLWKTLCIE